MAYTDPASATAGTVATAAFWNTSGRDNIRALFQGARGMASQAVYDQFYASSTTQLARLGMAAGQSMRRAHAGSSAEAFTVGLDKVGGTHAEGAVSSATIADARTVTFSPAIDQRDGIYIMAAIRRGTGASVNGMQMRLKLDAVIIVATIQIGTGVSSNEALSGFVELTIPPRATNYQRGMICTTHLWGATMGNSVINHAPAADLPLAPAAVTIGLTALNAGVSCAVVGATAFAIKGSQA